jgi:hypothetical protein
MNNRELKFRAWDNLKKEWLKRKVYHFNPHFNEEGIGEFRLSQHPEGFTIQQYTGLKDRNGNDIYEGDILMPDTIDGIWPEQRNGVMVKDIRQPFANAYLFKIVGNIFETPELIKTNE